VKINFRTEKYEVGQELGVVTEKPVSCSILGTYFQFENTTLMSATHLRKGLLKVFNPKIIGINCMLPSILYSNPNYLTGTK